MSCGDKRLGCGSGNFWQWILQLTFCLLLIMPVAAQAADLERFRSEAHDNKALDESPETVLGYLSNPDNAATWQGNVDKLNNIAGVLPSPVARATPPTKESNGFDFDASNMVRLANEIEAERNTPSVNFGGIGNALSRGIKRFGAVLDNSELGYHGEHEKVTDKSG